MSNPSVLACVLYTGEPSLASALKSLEAQRGVDVRLFLIGYHPKREAHQRLFKTLNHYGREHDFSIFLGSDMELTEPRLLESIATVYQRYPQIDRAIFGVQDWYSGEPQIGVSTWRRGVRHTLPRSALFTDIIRSRVRTTFKLYAPQRPLILHGVDPSELQAVRYGAQRGLKAAASGKESRWSRLQQLTEFVDENPHPGRSTALAGVLLALRDAQLGTRCISGEEPLSPTDLDTIRQTANSPSLVSDLRALTQDRDFWQRLAEERFEPQPSRRASTRLSLRGWWPRQAHSGFDHDQVSETFYAGLE